MQRSMLLLTFLFIFRAVVDVEMHSEMSAVSWWMQMAPGCMKVLISFKFRMYQKIFILTFAAQSHFFNCLFHLRKQLYSVGGFNCKFCIHCPCKLSECAKSRNKNWFRTTRVSRSLFWRVRSDFVFNQGILFTNRLPTLPKQQQNISMKVVWHFGNNFRL